MVQLLIEIDDELARKLEAAAPARSRKRSEFVRLAIRNALWELEERATAEAYTRQPEPAEEWIDPEAWEPSPPPRPRKRRR